jgi:hypothetical protein
MLKKYIIGMWCIALSVSAISCKKASMANNESEHQAINRIEMLFKQGGTTVSTIVAEDPDGDGGNPPSRIDNINLDINKIYDVEVKFFNISNGFTKDLSSTILQQAKQHEVYFIISGLTLPVEKKDKDDNGFPIGLISQWKTGNAVGKGTVLLKLMHKPLVKGANDDPNKGHSDIAINYTLNVK